MLNTNSISEQLLNDKRYSFIHTNEHLKDNIILLGLGGSHAYGTDTDTSDIDIRGVALNSKREILLGKDFEQVSTHGETDTVIYSFNKFIRLLTKGNPNVIELLGLKPEHYFIKSPIGTELINNRQIFLSTESIYKSFSGYINSLLKRLKQNNIHLEKDHTRITKTMMHIIRLYYMLIDILTKNNIITYRADEHDLLMNIRNGKYTAICKNFSNPNATYSIESEFFMLVYNLEKRAYNAQIKSSLPMLLDTDRIDKFTMNVNEKIVRSL